MTKLDRNKNARVASRPHLEEQIVRQHNRTSYPEEKNKTE